MSGARWSIWSIRREEWLRQDALGWASHGETPGVWSEAGAKQRADNLPHEDAATAVPEGGE